MREIPWALKHQSVVYQARDLIRETNPNIDILDRDAWELAKKIGFELWGCLEWPFEGDADDYTGNEASMLHSWLEHGFTLEDDFPDWTAPQLMAAYACYLVSDNKQYLADLPVPGDTRYTTFGWRRDELVEHCAGNIIEALEACRYGRQLIGQTITHDPEWLAQHVKRRISEEKSRGGKAKAANDPRQVEKAFVFECWKEWHGNPARYKSKVEFAQDMLDKCDHLKSEKKITDWCREWEKSEPC